MMTPNRSFAFAFLAVSMTACSSFPTAPVDAGNSDVAMMTDAGAVDAPITPDATPDDHPVAPTDDGSALPVDSGVADPNLPPGMVYSEIDEACMRMLDRSEWGFPENLSEITIRSNEAGHRVAALNPSPVGMSCARFTMTNARISNGTTVRALFCRVDPPRTLDEWGVLNDECTEISFERIPSGTNPLERPWPPVHPIIASRIGSI